MFGSGKWCSRDSGETDMEVVHGARICSKGSVGLMAAVCVTACSVAYLAAGAVVSAKAVDAAVSTNLPQTVCLLSRICFQRDIMVG